MFKSRKHATYVDNMRPYDRIMPHIMPHRSDAQVFFTDDIDCSYLDVYIAQKKEQGIELNYLDVFVAAAVRLYALRPSLNRFVMGGRVFANDKIYVSMAVKKSLRNDAGSTTIKIPFEGTETIFDVKKAFDEQIHQCKEKDDVNSTDKLAKLLTSVPNWLLRWTMGLVRVLDRSSMLPESFIQASPFHASFFITYLKSLGIPAIYHHIYNLGTISQFIAVGKERHIPVIDRKTGEVRPGKVLTIMIVADERICDGLYYARSMRMYRRILENLSVLEKPLDEKEKDIW